MNKKKFHININFLIFSILAFFGALLSYYLSPDTKSYRIIFENATIEGFIDPLFQLYIFFLNSLYSNFLIFLFITIYFIIILKNFTFKKLSGISINVFYLTTFFILHDLIQIRFALGVSFYLLGVYLIHNQQKRAGGILLLIISFLTHFSTITLLIPHFILILKLKKSITYLLGLIPIIIILFSNALLVYFEHLMSSKLISYVYQIGYNGLSWGIAKQHLYVIILTLILLLVYRGDKKKFIILMTILGLSFSIPIGNYPVISSRLFEIFIFILPLTQTLTYRELLRNRKIFGLLYALIVLPMNFYLFAINTIILGK